MLLPAVAAAGVAVVAHYSATELRTGRKYLIERRGVPKDIVDQLASLGCRCRIVRVYHAIVRVYHAIVRVYHAIVRVDYAAVDHAAVRGDHAAVRPRTFVRKGPRW